MSEARDGMQGYDTPISLFHVCESFEIVTQTSTLSLRTIVSHLFLSQLEDFGKMEDGLPQSRNALEIHPVCALLSLNLSQLYIILVLCQNEFLTFRELSHHASWHAIGFTP